ncbi:hypothetical protein F5Y18DRAFT_389541 [Xylariaceae sp. FL1019]|nr:hypothetical protein F5Y18DRAFT_389541 [Xylariaceae sp. FL1019]
MILLMLCFLEVSSRSHEMPSQNEVIRLISSVDLVSWVVHVGWSADARHSQRDIEQLKRAANRGRFRHHRWRMGSKGEPIQTQVSPNSTTYALILR